MSEFKKYRKLPEEVKNKVFRTFESVLEQLKREGWISPTDLEEDYISKKEFEKIEKIRINFNLGMNRLICKKCSDKINKSLKSSEVDEDLEAKYEHNRGQAEEIKKEEWEERMDTGEAEIC